tara:strand:+ start:646 stop:4305 length:3660 start_codon:yes stop_codon:yes gene_type:complete
VAKVGGPRVFFDIVGIFNATNMIKNMDAKMTVVESIVLDSMDAIMGSFAGISETITQITETTIPLAQALSEATIEFEKFAGVNKELAAGIIETGMGFGFTAEESLSAGAKMAQLTALIGESSVQAATEMGQTFALISGMGTTEAMTRMINMHQQTGFMYGDLTKAQFDLLTAEEQANHVRLNTIEILDQLNTVENRSASNMKQITFVMNQFAAQAHQTGESIANMAAMSAVLIESGEEQGKAGRALRMIYARLGADTSGAQQAIQELGIATHDANTGALRPLSSIVEELAVKFKNISAEERQRIVQTVAGNDHYVRFIKLIENQARMTELATDAVVNQSTAEEELNRVISDQSTKLREAQAELQHNQALLGQALVPAYTSATEVQARFTLGLAQLAETGIGKTFSEGIIILQRYGQILGGVFDTYLNIKSVNIAMKTHMAILRALNGEELVRTDTHRMRNTLATHTISLDEKIARIQNEILSVKLAISNLDALGFAEARTQHKVRLEQQLKFEIEQTGRLIEERNNLFRTEAAVRMQTAQIGEAAFLNEQNHHTSIKHSIMAKGAAQTQITEAEIASMLATNTLLEQEAIQLARIVHEKKIAHALDQKNSKEYIVLARARIAILEADMEQDRIRNRVSKMGIREIRAEIQHLTGQIEHQIAAQEKANRELVTGNAAHEQTIAHNAMLIAQNENLVDLQVILTSQAESEAARKSRIAAIDNELIMTMQQQGILKEDLNMLSQNEITHLTMLAGLKDRDSQLTLEQNLAMAQQNIERRKAMMGMKEMEPLMSSASMAMTRFSMAAGLASMSVHMLSDVFGLNDETSMRVSMILMTMSMIPAMAQMAMMTTQMTQLGVATANATKQLTVFSAVSKTLVFGLVLAGVALAFDAIIGGAGDATDEIDSMNDSLLVTTQLLDKMTSEEASSLEVPKNIADEIGNTFDLTATSVDELNDVIAKTEREMRKIDSHIETLGSDNPLVPSLLDDKGELQDFANLLDQALAVELSMRYQGVNANSNAARRMVLQDIEDGLLPTDGAPASFAVAIEPVEKFILQDMPDTSRTTYTSYMVPGRVGKDIEETIELINNGTLTMNDLTEEGKQFLTDLADAGRYLADNFGFADPAVNDLGTSIGGVSQEFTDAEEKMRSFANAREELFFGGRSQYMSGEMMKQVVNKGVENLYSNVELLMTNNFYGLTFDEAVSEISNRITDQLISQGVPIRST